jgi:hypothetical protein
MKATSILMAIAILASTLVALPQTAIAGTPSVVITPDTEFQPNEVETVSGSSFDANQSVQINLILPDGSQINGVAHGTVGVDGKFGLTFVSPDRSGDGYVVVVVNGTASFSTLVKFKGFSANALQLTIYPSQPTTNKTTTIEVINNELASKNYVVILQTTTPSAENTYSYHVLHNGICNIDKIFLIAGTYVFNVSIDGTTVGKRATVSILQATPDDDDDDDDTPYTGNITWTIDKAENVYAIQLSNDAGQVITSGIIKAKYPDSSEHNLNIISGSATLTASASGTYELTYTLNSVAHTKSISYTPNIRFTVSTFSSTGDASITLTVDGKTPTDSISINVLGDNSGEIDTVEIFNGQGTFSTNVPDTYTFTLDYGGQTIQKYSTYQDIYIINGLTASQSADKSTLTVSGSLVGQRSGRGIGNTLVKITVDYIGYTNSVRTGTDGTFRATISLAKENRGAIFGGALIDVKAQYGTDEASMTQVKITHNFWGEYGFTIAVGIIVLIGILWAMGILTTLSGGRIPKPFEGGGGGGGFGGGKAPSSKVLVPTNITLKPPKQMGLG